MASSSSSSSSSSSMQDVVEQKQLDDVIDSDSDGEAKGTDRNGARKRTNDGRTNHIAGAVKALSKQIRCIKFTAKETLKGKGSAPSVYIEGKLDIKRLGLDEETSPILCNATHFYFTIDNCNLVIIGAYAPEGSDGWRDVLVEKMEIPIRLGVAELVKDANDKEAFASRETTKVAFSEVKVIDPFSVVQSHYVKNLVVESEHTRVCVKAPLDHRVVFTQATFAKLKVKFNEKVRKVENFHSPRAVLDFVTMQFTAVASRPMDGVSGLSAPVELRIKKATFSQIGPGRKQTCEMSTTVNLLCKDKGLETKAEEEARLKGEEKKQGSKRKRNKTSRITVQDSIDMGKFTPKTVRNIEPAEMLVNEEKKTTEKKKKKQKTSEPEEKTNDDDDDDERRPPFIERGSNTCVICKDERGVGCAYDGFSKNVIWVLPLLGVGNSCKFDKNTNAFWLPEFSSDKDIQQILPQVMTYEMHSSSSSSSSSSDAEPYSEPPPLPPLPKGMFGPRKYTCVDCKNPVCKWDSDKNGAQCEDYVYDEYCKFSKSQRKWICPSAEEPLSTIDDDDTVQHTYANESFEDALNSIDSSGFDV